MIYVLTIDEKLTSTSITEPERYFNIPVYQDKHNNVYLSISGILEYYDEAVDSIYRLDGALAEYAIKQGFINSGVFKYCSAYFGEDGNCTISYTSHFNNLYSPKLQCILLYNKNYFIEKKNTQKYVLCFANNGIITYPRDAELLFENSKSFMYIDQNKNRVNIIENISFKNDIPYCDICVIISSDTDEKPKIISWEKCFNNLRRIPE